MENLTIKSWAEDDKPREKLMLKGKSALSDAELIAILIGSGNRNETAVDLSKRILSSVENNFNGLGKLSVDQLCKFKGIGEAKAIAIVAAMEVARRRRMEEVPELVVINTSKIVFNLMQPIIGELPYEEFWVLYVNNSNKLIYKTQISKGGITGTSVDKRIIFKIGFEQNAVGMILVHNHPSGKLQPSEADIAVTKDIQQAGKLLEIIVLDHIIITESSYYSFKDHAKI
jgi:DNA repair protein RadC